jgi:uncharacterized protein involved in exopolysaccharide biosynthesis
VETHVTEPAFYGRALRRGWWIVLAAVAVALAAAAILTARQRPVYRAEALLVVTPSSEVREPDEVLDALETLERRTIVATLARVPAAPETRDAAAERLGVEPGELRAYRVGGSVVPNTNVVRVEVQGPDAERTAEVANAAAVVTRRHGRRLYRTYSMRELARAEPPRRPVRPDGRRNLAVAGILGLFVGLLAAAALEAVRSPRRSPG